VLAQIGPVAERIARGKQAERILGAADMPPYFRVPFGDGWALVGDAGCRRNPITAQGIAGAFRDAERLSDTLDRGLSGRESMTSALAGYERKRNEEEMPLYEFTSQRSQLRPLTPVERDFYTRLSKSQADTDHYLGTLA
jgi:flavin-dependent dehydrogenase